MRTCMLCCFTIELLAACGSGINKVTLHQLTEPAMLPATQPGEHTSPDQVQPLVMEEAVQQSPLWKIIVQMQDFIEDCEQEPEIKFSATSDNVRQTSLTNIKSIVASVRTETLDFLLNKKSLNDYLFFLLNTRITYLRDRKNVIIQFCKNQNKTDLYIQPTSQRLFDFLNQGLVDKPAVLRYNKRVRMQSISLYEFFQLLLKQTFSMRKSEELNENTTNLLCGSIQLHPILTGEAAYKLGHPDQATSPYGLLEAILLASSDDSIDSPRANPTEKIKHLTTIQNTLAINKQLAKLSKSSNKLKEFSFLSNLCNQLIDTIDTETKITTRHNRSPFIAAIHYFFQYIDVEICNAHAPSMIFTQRNGRFIRIDRDSPYNNGIWPYPLPNFLSTQVETRGATAEKPKETEEESQKTAEEPKGTEKKRQQKKAVPKKKPRKMVRENKKNQGKEDKEDAEEALPAQKKAEQQETRTDSRSDLAPMRPKTVAVSQPVPLTAGTANTTETANKEPDKVNSTIVEKEKPTTPVSPEPSTTVATERLSLKLPTTTIRQNKPPRQQDTRETAGPQNTTQPPAPTSPAPITAPPAPARGNRIFRDDLVHTITTNHIDLTPIHNQHQNIITDILNLRPVKAKRFINLWQGMDGRIKKSPGGSHFALFTPSGLNVGGAFLKGGGMVYGLSTRKYLKDALTCLLHERQ